MLIIIVLHFLRKYCFIETNFITIIIILEKYLLTGNEKMILIKVFILILNT